MGLDRLAFLWILEACLLRLKNSQLGRFSLFPYRKSKYFQNMCPLCHGSGNNSGYILHEEWGWGH